ncbi:MAG: hypothetical protein Q4D12_07485 [Bacteroidales bacterium]|nr:hypothetical protein [Bacteroidales bacterium]
MTKIFKVVKQGAVSYVDAPKTESGKLAKSTLIVKELGGKFADTYACTLLGNDANSSYYEGELVAVELRFRAHESTSGAWFQDVTVEDIVKLKFS